jgi:micrococcal nuclease
MKLWPGWLVVLAAACTNGSTTVRSTTTPTTFPQPNAIVVRVIDGDTIDATIDGVEERVRLIGIDTPETKKKNTPIQCYGPEASAHTHDLLPPDTPIRIERDVVARDDYGRLLGYVYRSNDNLFVNLDIVQQGFAKVLTIPPNDTMADDFVEAARAAEAQNLGLWRACSG